MCSTQGPKEECYEFFENIVNYIEIAKSNAPLSKAENIAALSNAENICNSSKKSYGFYFKDEETAKSICKQIIKIYYSLTDNNKCISNVDPDYKKCFKFLNYWVNFKLKESMKNDDYTVCHVYNVIESQITSNDGYYILLDFISDINKDELNKMNILYSLYETYTDLRTILEDKSNVDTASTYNYSNKCFNDYYNAISMCKGKKNKFVEELERYKKNYETLYELVENRRDDYYTSFVRLTNGKNNNIVTSSVMGTTVGLIPLFGLLYKFTPIGQLFNPKKMTLTKEYSNNGHERKNNPLIDYENEQMNLEQEKYNIKYHSV